MAGRIVGLATVLGLAAAGPAAAQRSLFDQPLANDPPAATPVQSSPVPAAPPPSAPPAPAATAPVAAPAPRAAPARPRQARPAPDGAAKPKPTRAAARPVPARSLVINNATSTTLTALVITADGKTARLGKPLAPQKKATLRMPALKSCTVAVAATFDGQAAPGSDLDICQEKGIRFTE